MAFQWLDAFGRPVNLQSLRQEQATPTLHGVRRPNSMHPAAGLTPDGLAQLLRSAIETDPERYLALAEDMEERDLHYAGVLSIRKAQVASLEITVAAAGDDPTSQLAAEVVREVVARDGFQDELIDILDGIGKGFSCTEIIWETSAKQWRPKRLAWRDPRWFRFDRTDGETPLLRDPTGDLHLNPYQWIFHQAKAKSGLPIRGGLARPVSWAFMFKSFTIKDWAIFCEAYGQPLRLGKFHAGASETEKDKLLQAVQNIGVDYAAIVPQSMAVEFIKADVSGSHELYEKRADWIDRQVSKVVLGQTATTDAIAGGHAVGKTHDKVREDIERNDARRLAATLNRDLVRPVVDFEVGPQKVYPTIVIGRPEQIDADKFMGTVEKFVRMGGRVGMSTVRDKIGIPDPAPDEEVLAAPKSAPATEAAPLPLPGEKKPADRQAVHSVKNDPAERDAIDDAAEDMAAEWRELVPPIVAGLQERIAAASSLDEVRTILQEQFDGLDVAALTERLAQAAYAARLAGEAREKLSD